MTPHTHKHTHKHTHTTHRERCKYTQSKLCCSETSHTHTEQAICSEPSHTHTYTTKRNCTWTYPNLTPVDNLIQNGPHRNVKSVQLELVEPTIRHVAGKNTNKINLHTNEDESPIKHANQVTQVSRVYPPFGFFRVKIQQWFSRGDFQSTMAYVHFDIASSRG